MSRRISCLLILLGLAALSASARPGAAGRPFVCGLVSPDGHLSVDIARQDGALTYTLSAGRTPLLLSSPLGFRLRGGAAVPSAGWQVDVASSRKVRDVWKPLWGKRAEVPDRYRETVIRLRRPGSSETLLCVFRLYDDGLAFRYVVPRDSRFATPEVEAELTGYRFAEDFAAWSYNGEDCPVGPEPLSRISGERRPVVTLRAGSAHYLALHEACLDTGEPLRLASEAGSLRFGVASRPDSLAPGYASAWRVILYGPTPGALVDSHLLELLNPQPTADFSWVKPGLALWDWRADGAEWEGFRYAMSLPSWLRMVDFAAEAGFRYLVLDANWYGPEFASDSDPVSGDKAADVRRLITYARSRGVGIWLYLNDVGGRRYPLETTLKQYSDWGAAGIKYGFMRGTPAEKNVRTRHITELCARHHLLVDYHDDPVHPYGQMRTWPNAVTREYCHAQLDGHHVFTPSTFCTSVFVNMIAGPLDMNNGMFDLRQGPTTRVDESQPVPSTVVAEAARTLITFSGVTILPDIPEYYRRYPALLRFLSAQKMPWLESRTLSGAIGEHIMMLRETADAYLVAAATNEEARELTLPLTFLPRGRFRAEIVEDGPGAHYLTARETLRTSRIAVTRRDSLRLRLAPGGGACVLIPKARR